MKTKVIILVIIGIFLTSCGAGTATQEIEAATKAPATQAPMTQEPVVTEELVAFVATELPTEMPTEPPLACITLLKPENGTDLPVTGKVTFSWAPINEAESYVISFILPSGSTVSFETNQTFRDRYMEAFVSGGEYQWWVTARGKEGNDICVSEVSTFDKSAYEEYEKTENHSNGDENNTAGEIPELPPPPTGEPH
jgi:hypothetical protein